MDLKLTKLAHFGFKYLIYRACITTYNNGIIVFILLQARRYLQSREEREVISLRFAMFRQHLC